MKRLSEAADAARSRIRQQAASRKIVSEAKKVKTMRQDVGKKKTMLQISKTEAARRQLETAIRLWFFDGEPVSIHTLAAAAHQLVHDLGKSQGITAVLRELADVRPGCKKELKAMVAQYENFFKHADHDPAALLDFHPETTEFYIGDAVVAYERLTGERPHIFRTFLFWMMMKHPELGVVESRAQWDAQMQFLGPKLQTMSKQEFCLAYLKALALNEIQ
jgi:hypothetical protein